MFSRPERLRVALNMRTMENYEALAGLMAHDDYQMLHPSLIHHGNIATKFDMRERSIRFKATIEVGRYAFYCLRYFIFCVPMVDVDENKWKKGTISWYDKVV